MIRLIIEVSNFGAAANLGGPVDVGYKTFDVDLPDVERFLKNNTSTYSSATLKGIEIIGREQ